MQTAGRISGRQMKKHGVSGKKQLKKSVMYYKLYDSEF